VRARPTVCETSFQSTGWRKNTGEQHLLCRRQRWIKTSARNPRLFAKDARTQLSPWFDKKTEWLPWRQRKKSSKSSRDSAARRKRRLMEKSLFRTCSMFERN